jgi:hypothetical protein
VYGSEALELRLPDKDPEEKVLDFFRRPAYYHGVVNSVRHHLAEKHCHQARLRELIEIIES